MGVTATPNWVGEENVSDCSDGVRRATSGSPEKVTGLDGLKSFSDSATATSTSSSSSSYADSKAFSFENLRAGNDIVSK